MGNLGFGMVVQLFLDVVKASAVASVGILLVFAVSPVLEKRHTVFWRYLLFLCLAIRLALPFDISLSKWAAVIPVSASFGMGEGILGEAGTDVQDAVNLGEKTAEAQGEEAQGEIGENVQEAPSLKEKWTRANLQGNGSQGEKESIIPEGNSQGEKESIIPGGNGQEGSGARLQAASIQKGAENAVQEAGQAADAENHAFLSPSYAGDTYKGSLQEEEDPFAKGSILWWASLCWAVGAVIYWAWQIGCYGVFLHKVRKTKCLFGKTGHIPVYTSKAIPSPMLTGIWKPQILLPAGEYSKEQLEYILGHEFAHYKRKDLWARLLLAAARAVHWFNPLVAVMERRAMKDMEFLCDSQAVKGFTKEEKKQYGRTLLAFADSRGSRRPILCTSGLSREGEELKERFSNLFSSQKKRGILVAVFGIAGLLAVSLFIAFGSSAPVMGERQTAGQPEGIQSQLATDASDRDAASPREMPNAKAQKEAETISEEARASDAEASERVEAAPASINLSAKMQNEEPIAPPGTKPEIVADQAEITMENAAEEMKNLLSTQEENLIYVKKGYGYEIYRNQDRDKYGFDEAGDVVFYQSSMDLYVYGAAKTSVEECQEAADYYLSLMVEDPSYYTLELKSYWSEKHCYVFIYKHKVQGMDTNDQIQMQIHDLHRNLVFFKNPKSGVFREMDDVVVDEEIILQKALELFSQRHHHEGELINPKLDNILVKQVSKRDKKGEIGYEVYFSVANEDICGCETVQFVPFHSVMQ